MFERFTSTARAVATRAHDEAVALRAPLVGTEHLLLGLLDPSATIAQPILAAYGIHDEAVRATLRRLSAGPAGLLGPEDAEALRTIGIDLEAVLAKIGETFGEDALDPPPATTRWFGRATAANRFSPRARKTLGLALREAVRLGDKRIDDGHLLLGLLRSEGLAMKIIDEAGVPAGDLRAAVERVRRSAA